MIKSLLFLISFMLLLSCSGDQISTSKENIIDVSEVKEDETNLIHGFTLDTILERTNPDSIDLTKYQVFIDTTRTSEFYQRKRSWDDSWGKSTINEYLTEINKTTKPIKINLKGFPSQFITLRKLNGKFILYDRCDGIDPRYEVRDTAVIFYGPLEADAESITKVFLISKDKIELGLKGHPAKLENQTSRLQITKIDDCVYKMIYKNQSFEDTSYLTTRNFIGNFDLVVNNCPTMKMPEFN